MRYFIASTIGILTSVTVSLAQTPAPSAPPASDAPAKTEAAPEAAAKPLERPFDLMNNQRLTGDWWGGRRWIEDRGIDFGLSLTTVYQHNAHGGIQTHNGHRIPGLGFYELIFDTEKLGLWKGGTIYTGASSSWGDDIGGDRVGNIYGVNAAAVGDDSGSVAELWYAHQFFDGLAKLKVGKMDLTVDIDTNAYANDETSQFMNPALGNTGNIPAPPPGLGALLLITPAEWCYLGLAVADDQSNPRETGFQTTFHDEDYFFSGMEIGFLPTWNTPWGKLPGGYRVGMWYDPEPKARFYDDRNGRDTTIPMKRDDVGFYYNMDQMLVKENPFDDADKQGLGMFFRYGYAHKDANPIEHFWSIGAQYQGLIPRRDNDVLGFGVAQGILSEKMRYLGVTPHRETILELYYNIALLPWLTLTPDFQWILDPGGVMTTTDSFVAGMRLQASF